MKLLEIFHNGKDEYGNDGHNAAIELDDGSIMYIPEKLGGVEFENKIQQCNINFATEKALSQELLEIDFSVGRGLDELIAINVMGWRKHPHETHYITQENRFIQCGEFEPSADISAAWMVLEKIISDMPGNSLPNDCFFHKTTRGWSVNLDNRSKYQNGNIEAETAPLAICQAALLAVMGGV